jgi:hypothetical protein
MTVFNPTFGFKGFMAQMHGRKTLVHDLGAAVIAGQFAGLVMAAVVMLVFTLFLGKEPLYPVQLIGSIFFGEAALVDLHLPALAAGLLLHQLGPALAYSILFGFCVHSFEIEGMGKLMTLGLGIGILSQVIDSYFLVPAAFTAMQGTDLWAREVPETWSWAAHVVYGLCLGIYPFIDEKLSKP